MLLIKGPMMSVGLSDSRRGGRQLPDGVAVSSQNFETDSSSEHFVKGRRASEVK